MLKPYKLADYQYQFQPEWAFAMTENCLPDEVVVPYNHFFRHVEPKNAAI